MYGRLLIYRPFLLIVRQSVLKKIELIYKIFYLYIYKFYNRIWHALNVSLTLMYININHLQNKLSIF
ncbi:hypothetical protein CUMW_102560 [Citrus unshiu]|uniref:Uncharacterized protein n=1 Tax=Citrus sinensis TaxID=2711 RepID=A0A067D2E5_CITSI|nr:hypothetical protein CISIN_1g046076mg [Citrus sinensis]GAY47164.1 hypothetical protein CUMW_102560 [Citrus unshiu]